MTRWVVACLLLMVIAGPSIADDYDNVAVVEQMIDAVNTRNFDALGSFISANVVRHSASTPGVVVTNLAEFKQFLDADLAACPDAQQEVEIIFGAGDMVAVRARYIGHQSGQMGPFPPSGKPLDLPFMAILRLEDGKIAELWVEWDNMNALAQLGHFPPPTPTGVE